jgi:glutamate-1-semialdehyde 2,1-aminomutase/spore coat polysaccharide biosynthesis protein SpsF
VSNYHPPTFPDGLDVEGCPISILEIAWREARQSYEREHTFPFIWDNPERFKIGNITNPYGNMFLTHRWTLDYREDYLFIKRVIEELGFCRNFSILDILTLLKRKPEISSINDKFAGVNWYKNASGKLKTVPRYLYKRDKPLNLSKSLNLLKKAKKIIPCATQTLSKGYSQWSVGASPLFIESAKGCEVYDVDGNAYVDYAMGLGPFILGYCDPDVNAAVIRQLEKGTMFTLPHPLETAAAERIIKCIPCAEMVRFGKNGSDATTAAVKLARAYTSKEKIITCGYHGWHDWYIASTERNLGVPKCLKEIVLPLKYNDLNGLKEIISRHKSEIAGLIMEPVTSTPPKKNFLQEVRRITLENGIVLIFDELFTGFRWGMGGAQEYFNVIPDLACFGKAIANGFPVSVVTGKRKIMLKLEEVFYSFTYGGETLSLAAIIATLDKLKEKNVHKHIERMGGYLIQGVRKLIRRHGLSKSLEIVGYPFKSVVNFCGDEHCVSLEMKTYFQQECARRGVLFIGYHLLSWSHKKEHVDFTLEVYDQVMGLLRKVLNDGRLKDALEGGVVTQVFRNVGDRSLGLR